MKKYESWAIEFCDIEGRKMISIRFDKNEKWINEVKSIKGARWNHELKCWLILDCASHRQMF
jgi:hypothetical protein